MALTDAQDKILQAMKQVRQAARAGGYGPGSPEWDEITNPVCLLVMGKPWQDVTLDEMAEFNRRVSSVVLVFEADVDQRVAAARDEAARYE